MFPSVELRAVSLVPFSLKSLEGFPYEEYLRQQAIYLDRQYWYDGEWLEEQITDTASGKKIDKYPIKINPLKQTARKHASVLLGSNLDSIRFGGIPIQFIPDVDKGEEEKAKTVRKALSKIFEKSGGGSLFVSNSITSQYKGGCVFAAKWLPEEKTIEISNPQPNEIVGIPNGGDYWNFKEAWIVREITEFEANSYGYNTKPLVGEQKFYYIEHWTPTTYKITINDMAIRFSNGMPQAGAHPFKKVPIVYIPHIREGKLLGEGIITEAVKGILRELNLRWADIGDAVSEDSHGVNYIANVRGSAKTVTIDGRTFIDLGSNPNITGNEASPLMDTLKVKSTSDPMIKYGEKLITTYRREVNHPAVADGEDEGSQRSSLTLTTRMWPMVSEVEMERVFWTVGLTVFANILLEIMAEKNIFKITKDMISDLSLVVQWQPMLPRDRDAIVQEIAVRAKNKVGSRKHLMEKLGDVIDPDEELEQIRDEKDIDEVQQPGGFGGVNSNAGTTSTKVSTE